MTQELQRKSFRSLYEQIADRLREDIVEAGAGGQLPTEEALMLRYGVSRSTVRKAVQRLVDESILFRRQGKGTFVAQPLPQIVHSIDHIAPFFETFRQAGEDIRTEIIDFSWSDTIVLPAELDAWQRPVLSYQRRYVSRGVPHAVAQVSVPLNVGRKIARGDLESAPIYDVLQKKLGLKLARAEFLVSGRQPPLGVGEALDISQSSFMLVLDRITRDIDGNPVEMTTHFLRPDVYKLSVALAQDNHT
jgi:GntR family transcriptional regulator